MDERDEASSDVPLVWKGRNPLRRERKSITMKLGKFIRAVQAVLNSTKGKIGRGVDFFEEAFGRDIDEFIKILWMPETFIIYRRIYDADLRSRLSRKYTTVTMHDCDLANEWWEKFRSLPPQKLELAKSIIALNKFKSDDISCNDKEILEVLSYYTITRDEAEA